MSTSESATDRPTTWLSLPEEIHRLVLEYLPPSSRLPLLQTCKAMYGPHIDDVTFSNLKCIVDGPPESGRSKGVFMFKEHYILLLGTALRSDNYKKNPTRELSFYWKVKTRISSEHLLIEPFTIRSMAWSNAVEPNKRDIILRLFIFTYDNHYGWEFNDLHINGPVIEPDLNWKDFSEGKHDSALETVSWNRVKDLGAELVLATPELIRNTLLYDCEECHGERRVCAGLPGIKDRWWGCRGPNHYIIPCPLCVGYHWAQDTHQDLTAGEKFPAIPGFNDYFEMLDQGGPDEDEDNQYSTSSDSEDGHLRDNQLRLYCSDVPVTQDTWDSFYANEPEVYKPVKPTAKKQNMGGLSKDDKQ